MENIILTNNKDLRLVSVKVGVLSTLRFELPLVSASATHVEVIVTSGNVPSAYTATFIDATKRWQCDIAASQFPAVGRQSYEVAYVLDGKQFWDGKGWIEIENATTSGIEPQPRPEPYRYVVVSVNGYGADAQGAVRTPKTFIATDSPTTTEGFMEGDIYFNRETGATWTLCNVQSTLTWVFNYKNYYTKQETDEAIDRVAAYYITYDAAGNPFPTYASLANATTVYSGGSVRVPTRNDYCVVLADETHGGAEYRYIYAVAEGETTGSWQSQFPVEGVMTVDQTVQKNSQNPVSGGGVWSMLWGALAALPTGFSSLYDWVVSQLAGKASKSDATLTPVYSQTPTFSEWTILRNGVDATAQVEQPYWVGEGSWYVGDSHIHGDAELNTTTHGTIDSTSLSWVAKVPEPSYPDVNYTATRVRTDILGYQLGSQTTKPVASEAEAEALRNNKLDKSGGTVTGEFRVAGTYNENFQVVPEQDDGGSYISPTMRFGDGVGVVGIIWRIVDGYVVMDVTDIPGTTSRIAFPSDSGTLALLQNLAPDFSTASTYALDALCVHDRVLYRCTTPIATAEAWTAAHWTTATVEDVLAVLREELGNKVDGPPSYSSGNLASFDNNGSLEDSGINRVSVAVKDDIPYNLVTKTISNGAVTLDDHASNSVTISATLSPNTLTINFPTTTSDKVRDFAMRLNIAAGVTAPEIAWPQGVTLENNGGEVPEIADGGTGGSSTILYFSETENNGTTAKFLVKGETLTAIAQA